MSMKKYSSNRTITAIALALAVFTTSLGAIDKANHPYGPLYITGQTPLQTLRLDIVPTRLDILDYGQAEYSLFNNVTNRWNRTSSYLLDLEVVQNIFIFNLGLGGGFEIGAELPVLSLSGGNMDRFIMDFHDGFGLGQADRSDRPLNAMTVSYMDENGETVVILDEDDRGTIIGDVSVTGKYQLINGNNKWFNTVVVTVLMRFPTATERFYYGSGGIDGAVSLAARHRINPFYLYTTVGYGIYGSGTYFGLDLRPYQWTFFSALEWPVHKRFSLVIQQLVNSGVARGQDSFSDPTWELVLGAKHYIGKGLYLEYGITENLFFFSNSNDFGLSLGMTFLP